MTCFPLKQKPPGWRLICRPAQATMWCLPESASFCTRKPDLSIRSSRIFWQPFRRSVKTRSIRGMPVDNELYNRLSHTWWDENAPLGLLRTWLNPARFGYLQKVLAEQAIRDPQSMSLLDAGCGGGLLAEELARLGCHVTGVDPSEPSLETARVHARLAGLEITYVTGSCQQLPFATASFDMVVCCDVLEHLQEIEAGIGEMARVLKPGGIFFYDTLNRPWLTWLGAI